MKQSLATPHKSKERTPAQQHQLFPILQSEIVCLMQDSGISLWFFNFASLMFKDLFFLFFSNSWVPSLVDEKDLGLLTITYKNSTSVPISDMCQISRTYSMTASASCERTGSVTWRKMTCTSNNVVYENCNDMGCSGCSGSSTSTIRNCEHANDGKFDQIFLFFFFF